MQLISLVQHRESVNDLHQRVVPVKLYNTSLQSSRQSNISAALLAYLAVCVTRWVNIYSS